MRLAVPALPLLAAMWSPAAHAAGPAPDFVRDVQPLLETHCTRCHGPNENKGGLRLHTADAIRKGGIGDNLIVAGHSERSYLVQRLLGQGGEDPMPPPKAMPALPPAGVAIIRAWIDAGAVLPKEEEIAFQPAPAGLRRLTDEQYRNAVRDVLGVAVTDPLHAGGAPEQFTTVAAYGVTTAEWSVELYRDTALAIARAIFSDGARREAVVGCRPRQATDACARRYLARVGRRLFRRPLDAGELRHYGGLARKFAASFRSPWIGLEGATAALLQSPSFLYAWEEGAGDPQNAQRPQDARRLLLSGPAVATRMALFLWGSLPDEALLDAAERGALATAEGVRAEARRMLASPRAREGVGAFFSELLHLDELPRLAKDPALYPANTPSLRQAMREEVRRLIERVVFDQPEDAMSLFDTRRTFVNAELARLYGLAGEFPQRELVPVTLPEASGRRGLLGTAAFLATNAINTRSSPTARGVFVRERLLCQEVPPPPDNVSTSDLRSPEGEQGPRTMRQRLAQHATDKVCANCHRFFDPIGLALESFDGLGAYRSTDEGRPLDVSGQIDGARIDGLPGLARVLREHPRAAGCLTEQLYRYATGHGPAKHERPLVDALTAGFVKSGRDLQALLIEIVASDGFRTVAAPTPVATNSPERKSP